MWRADLLIAQGLMVNLLRKVRERALNLKDFLAGFLSNSRARSSGLVGRPKRGEADLLIMRGLSANSLRKKREGLLNLKDLPTLFPPGLRGLFEDQPVLKPRFCAQSRQIQPFSGKNVAESGREPGFWWPISS
ncbi:MAG TPA: hypothetical protein VKM93_11845 [Terriglobia bacterium]|nr:hypothetical protein [Terriglobia bacterium]